MTCCKCNLISYSDFVSRVDIPENIDLKKVNIAINETKFLIKKYICPDLYDELCQQIDDDDVTELNSELLCFIADIWVRFAYAELFTQSTMKLTKENVNRKMSDESELVSYSEAEKMANDWRMKAQNYINEMLVFMKNNEGNGEGQNPLYSRDCFECSDHKDDNFGGVTYAGIA